MTITASHGYSPENFGAVPLSGKTEVKGKNRIELGLRGLRVPQIVTMNYFDPPSIPELGPPDPIIQPQEVRCAVRFPLSLPMVLSTGDMQSFAHTRDVSANGVLFECDQPLETGLQIRFSLRMPHAVLGAPHDVLVHCLGRVVRCSMSHSHYLAASTIDQYEFAEP